MDITKYDSARYNRLVYREENYVCHKCAYLFPCQATIEMMFQELQIDPKQEFTAKCGAKIIVTLEGKKVPNERDII